MGSGIMLSSASAFGSRRLAGMMLPGKQPAPPVVTLQAPRRQRILDEHQPAVGVEGLREIARALERRRHAVEPHLARASAPAAPPSSRRRTASCRRPCRRPGNLHRSAEVEAGRVDLQLGLGDAGPLVLPRRRVPRVAPAVPVAAAVIVRAAALADDLDVGAGAVAELRLVGVQQHLHLGDRVEVDRRVHAVGARQLVAVQAVDRHLVPGPALAGDVRDLRSEAVAHRVDVVLVVHAGQQPQQVDDVAALGLDLRDLRRRQQAGVVAVLGLDDGAAGGDVTTSVSAPTSRRQRGRRRAGRWR